MRFNDLLPGDPVSGAAAVVEEKTGSKGLGVLAAAALGYLMRGPIGAVIGVGAVTILKPKAGAK